MQKLKKKERQGEIADLLKREGASSQKDLVAHLNDLGAAATQATVSRDLAELGAVKVEGRYRLPNLHIVRPRRLDIRIDTAGDHLVVVKTAPGQASMAALRIDQSDLPDVIGTVAGDDTILIAVKGKRRQGGVIRNLFKLLS